MTPDGGKIDRSLFCSYFLLFLYRFQGCYNCIITLDQYANFTVDIEGETFNLNGVNTQVELSKNSKNYIKMQHIKATAPNGLVVSILDKF